MIGIDWSTRACLGEESFGYRTVFRCIQLSSGRFLRIPCHQLVLWIPRTWKVLKPFLSLRLCPAWDDPTGMTLLLGVSSKIYRTRLHDMGLGLLR